VVRLVVGLGNPGSSYSRTRHNAGFWTLERFAERHGLRFGEKNYRSQVARGEVGGRSVVLLKPQTYMNASGEAVGRARRDLRLDPREILVVYDEIDLPLGRLRVRMSGSAGGHRGVASIIAAVGGSDFPRIRVGVGRAGDAADYVLDVPTAEEMSVLRDAVDRAAEAIEICLTDGVAAAMNRFNPKG
jgi:peptidyl-tRNA hydrolase, PTH1 family